MLMKNFSWGNFDNKFIKSIVYSERTRRKHRPPFETNDLTLLIPWMERISVLPDDEFVKYYRNEILDYFIAGSVHLVNITRKLEKKHYRGIEAGVSMEEMLFNLKKLRLTKTLINLLKSELRSRGKNIDEDEVMSFFTYPKSIDLKASIAHDTSLYDYQEEAVNKLTKFFITEDKTAGVLAMPTGSGKTRVASYFLLREMVSKGYQVVWLTHRAMLIEQTADAFFSSATLVKLADNKREKFKMVCVSNQHSNVRALEKDDDVMILSVQSICRNTVYLPAVLGPKVIIVVDEAHHTLAPTYRQTIKAVRAICPSAKLLGLTATPVRMSEEGTNQLMSLFEGEIIYSISMSQLIAEGTLATPQYLPIQTNIDFETNITLDEKAYIKKWGELSPSLVQKMANTSERNELIVQTYLKHKEKFGKTLIFALDSTHCISLCEEFQKQEGIRCDYIYCAHTGNEEKIERFKNNELDVLVNINVMTEGSDVPDIQTVFLTRPTTSDVLLMQMIGRGMRGKHCGGTEKVNIVDFCDKWTSFTRWLNPQFLFEEPGDPKNDYEPVSHSRKSDPIPWEMIRDIINGIQTTIVGQYKTEIALPVGWYDVIDEEGNDARVLVFEEQRSGYEQLLKDKDILFEKPDFSGEEALDKYFGGFGLMPTAYDLQLVLDYLKEQKTPPLMKEFSERELIDASIIGKKLKAMNARVDEIESEIEAVYNSSKDMLDSIYGSFESYKGRVYDFIKFPDGIVPLGARIEEFPYEFYTLDRTPIYNLEELVAEVIKEMFDGDLAAQPAISWTDKYYQSYFGAYYRDSNRIKINCILNSKDVPREVVKYIIYHELLHHLYPQNGHDKEFRTEEHKYPDFTEHEHFLDFTFPKFQLKYAL